MPKLMVDNDQEEFTQTGVGAFTFSGVRPENLDETEYTLATIVIDTSGSVYSFESDLLETLKSSVEACKKDPKANNILVRVIEFNSVKNTHEIHGFKPVTEIDINDYAPFNTGGTTPLIDSCIDSIGASIDYGVKLSEQDFDVNAIVIVITDGMENTSNFGINELKNRLSDPVINEEIDSLNSILVGLVEDQDQYIKDELKRFKDEAGIKEYIDFGEATPAKLAKLAGFISRSISSTSQAIGSGQSVKVSQLAI